MRLTLSNSDASAPVATPTPQQSVTTPIFIKPYKPCPPDVDDNCLHGECQMIFRENKWRGPVCRCEEMYFGKRCEFFRPPVFKTGMLTETETALVAGGIFIFILIIIVIVCIYVGVKYYRQRDTGRNSSRQQQPLITNGHVESGGSSPTNVPSHSDGGINNNNNNNNNVPLLKETIVNHVSFKPLAIDNSSQKAFYRPVSRFADDSSSSSNYS